MAEPRVLTEAEIAALTQSKSAPFARNDRLSTKAPSLKFIARGLEARARASAGADTNATASAPPKDAPDGEAAFEPREAPPTIDIEAEKRAAFEAGKAAAAAEHAAERADIEAKAQEIAQWDAEARIAAASDPIRAILAGLTAQVDAREAALADRIEAAVQALASERAGQAIDAAPPPFRARIERLVRDVAADAALTSVTLNPDDLAALKAAGNDLARMGEALFTADAALSRGDVALAFGHVRVADTLEVGDGITAYRDSSTPG
ncbi:MAG: FliH/SctL family protein [Pseudomonadota bacterium]